MTKRDAIIKDALGEIRRQHADLDPETKRLGMKIKEELMQQGRALAILAVHGSIKQLKACAPAQFAEQASVAIATEILEEVKEHIAN